MKTRNVLILLIFVLLLIPGFFVARFVLVNLKSGYDQAERQAATQPAAPPPPAISDNHAQTAKPPAVDFSKVDFSQNSTDVHNRTDNFVAKLPPLHGSGRNGFHTGMVGQGNFELHGGVESIAGASSVRLPSASHSGGLVSLELFVEKGTVRVYLLGLDGHIVTGYVWADASPGHPARVTGYLEDWSDRSDPEQNFVLEARDGDAEGVSYRVYRKE